jgi:hypothetical protein
MVRNSICFKLCFIPWKNISLLFEVFIQTLLNIFQSYIAIAQSGQHVRHVSCFENMRVFVCIFHDTAPVFIDSGKISTLGRHLTHYVVRAEYRSQIEP